MVYIRKRKLRFHGRLRFAYRALRVMLFVFNNSKGQGERYGRSQTAIYIKKDNLENWGD
jgi:hypothetical protein